MIHASVDRRDDGNMLPFFPFQKGFDRGHPLPDQQVSVYVGLKEQQIGIVSTK